MIKAIPSIITFSNLYCGYLAGIYALDGKLDIAFYLILLAAFLDFWDGFFARLLNAQSAFGKELDSLADAISFGIAPALIMFSLLSNSDSKFIEQSGVLEFLPYLSGLILVGAVGRLAYFNVDKSQSQEFKGLASPANAILISAIAWSIYNQGYYRTIFASAESLVLLTFFSAIIMNLRQRMFSLKFKNLSWKDNKVIYLFLSLSIVSLLFLNFEAIPVIILLYIVLSIIYFSRK